MSQGQVMVIDDTSTNVTYAGDWLYDTNFASIYHLYENTDSYSEQYGATATLRFYGATIEYWGNEDYNRGPCLLTLDGDDVGTVTSYSATTTDPLILWSNYNLPLGDHTLVITVKSPQSGLRCEIDRFVVTVPAANPPAPASTPTSTPAVVNTPNSFPVQAASSPSIDASSGVISGVAAIHTSTGIYVSGSSTSAFAFAISSSSSTLSETTSVVSAHVSDLNTNPKPSTSSIIGVVFGILVLVCLLAFLLWWWRRRSRRSQMAHLPDHWGPNVEEGGMVSTSGDHSSSNHRATRFITTTITPSSDSESETRRRAKEGYRGFNPSPIYTVAPVTRVLEPVTIDSSSRSGSPAPPPAYHG